MGLHVYGIVPAGQRPPDGIRGVDDAAVELLDAGAIGLWYSRLDARPAASVAAARAHNQVLAAALTPEMTPVPARFGQWFADAESAAEKIGAEESRWLAELARFRGRAEFGVRVTAFTPDAAGDAAAQDVHPAARDQGTQYMLSLARKHAEAERRREAAARIAAAVAAAAGELVVESRVQAVEDGAGVAHLVAWTDATAYHTAMRRLEAQRRDLRMLFTGPWPPYSFVNDA